MSREILIYGAGGAGRDLAFGLSLDNNPKTAWKVGGFIDDTPKLWGKRVNGVPVLGGFEYLKEFSGNLAVTIVNNPIKRRELIKKIKENSNIKFPVIKSSQSIFSPFVKWGEGCIVAMPGNVLTVNVKLGKFVYINAGNRKGHDVVIGDYTTIYTVVAVGGGVTVGNYCVIGTGAIILPKVKIGGGSIIGAGTVVSKNIPSKVVAAGVPAKIIRRI